MDLEKIISNYLWREIEKLKSSMPKHRRSLKELLESNETYVLTNDEVRIVFDKDELVEFSKYVPERYWDKVLLPLILVRDPRLGPGMFEVLASEIEKRALLKILGENSYYEGEKLILRTDQVEKLLKKFKSLIHIVILFRTDTP